MIGYPLDTQMKLLSLPETRPVTMVVTEHESVHAEGTCDRRPRVISGKSNSSK